MNTKKLAFSAVLAAMCAVLGTVAVDMGTIKITFESLPVMMAALLMGPVSGAMVGLIGSFISQMLMYGVSLTTPLWILPYVVCGLVMGLLAKKYGYEPDRKQLLVSVIIGELCITALNTVAIYADSVIYGYYYKGIILAMIGWRLLVCAVKAVAFAYVLPLLLKPVKKVL